METRWHTQYGVSRTADQADNLFHKGAILSLSYRKVDPTQRLFNPTSILCHRHYTALENMEPIYAQTVNLGPMFHSTRKGYRVSHHLEVIKAFYRKGMDSSFTMSL